jgi:hypothetical protein
VTYSWQCKNWLKQVHGLPDADRFKQWKWVAGGSCGVLLLLIVLSALAAGGGGGARLPDTSHRIYARMLIVGCGVSMQAASLCRKYDRLLL